MAADPLHQTTTCSCRTCATERAKDMPMHEAILHTGRFFACETCGNKRCPHATDHRLACTGSNAPGQAGSVYQ